MTGRLGGDGARFTSDITLFDHFSLFIADELSQIRICLSSAPHHDRTTLIVKPAALRSRRLDVILAAGQAIKNPGGFLIHQGIEIE